MANLMTSPFLCKQEIEQNYKRMKLMKLKNRHVSMYVMEFVLNIITVPFND